jgi:PleD family two-component response regulator
MAANNSLQQTYRDYFSAIVKQWGGLRQSRDKEELKAFQSALSQWLEWATHSRLQTLENLLSDMLAHVQNKSEFDNAFIGHIDGELNRIISATKAPQNQYLIQAEQRRNTLKALSQLNVAIIDDSEIARISTKAMLDRFNFDVTAFESIYAFEGNEKALTETNVILLDVVMPNVTEELLFGFARKMRERGINIILVSGIDEFDIRLKAVRADIGGYVTKPFDINSLVSNIRWMCDLDVERPFQVLLLDDQKTVGQYLGKYAKQNDIDLKFYSNTTDFFKDLDIGIPDMFLLDVNMPDASGMEVCKILRQQQRFEYVPIVFLSADDRLETKLDALSAGGDDVIIKDNPPEIIFKQIERRIVRGQQIRTMAVKDSLTGLLNHGQAMDVTTQWNQCSCCYVRY